MSNRKLSSKEARGIRGAFTSKYIGTTAGVHGVSIRRTLCLLPYIEVSVDENHDSLPETFRNLPVVAVCRPRARTAV